MSWEINYRVWLMEKFISSRILKRVWAKQITEPVIGCSKKRTVSFPGLHVLNLHILKENPGLLGSLRGLSQRREPGAQHFQLNLSPHIMSYEGQGQTSNRLNQLTVELDGDVRRCLEIISFTQMVGKKKKKKKDDFSQRSLRRESCWFCLPNISVSLMSPYPHCHRPHPGHRTSPAMLQ